MNRQVFIYTEDQIPEHYPNTDYVKLNASLAPGCFRLTPASIKRICENYDTVMLSLPLSTNDAFQQGNEEIQQAFILELFQHWAAKHPVTLLLKKGRTAFSDKKAVRHVTSVQAWYDNAETPALDIAQSYFLFLPDWTRKIIKVQALQNKAVISFLKIPLLVLKKDEPADLPLTISSWLICGGLLVSKNTCPKGRLWFVKSGHKPGLTYSAITHFRPAIPWILYVHTQARIHQFVMQKFADTRLKITRRWKENH